MKETIKRHLISFAITFLAMFILTLVPLFENVSFEGKVITSLVISAGRSAFKVAYEFAIIPLMNILLEWAKNYKK